MHPFYLPGMVPSGPTRLVGANPLSPPSLGGSAVFIIGNEQRVSVAEARTNDGQAVPITVTTEVTVIDGAVPPLGFVDLEWSAGGTVFQCRCDAGRGKQIQVSASWLRVTVGVPANATFLGPTVRVQASIGIGKKTGREPATRTVDLGNINGGANSEIAIPEFATSVSVLTSNGDIRTVEIQFRDIAGGAELAGAIALSGSNLPSPIVIPDTVSRIRVVNLGVDAFDATVIFHLSIG